MQGSIKALVLTSLTIGTVLAALILAGASLAAPTRTSCSDLNYLTSAVKGTKKSIAALKLAQRDRYSAALAPAGQALSIAKHAPTPCDYDYRLQRAYEIKYAVATYRWLEEMRDGDEDSADIYWSSVKFWGNEIRDISLGK
jgi:hypothetical protein